MAIQLQLHEILGRRRNSGQRLTLPVLAERCGVNYLVLWRWANGKTTSTSHDLLSALCRELDCQPGDLLAYVLDEPDSDAATQSDDG
ncbi:MAG: helix-turn-helix domain-containing protein [Acidobacteriota bacterium]